MIAQINNIDGSTFSFNGNPYRKIFVAKAIGDNHLQILNVYDSRLELLPPTKYQDVEVGGNTFTSLSALMNALLSVTYVAQVNSSGGNSGGGSGASLSQADRDAINSISGKLDKGHFVGNADDLDDKINTKADKLVFVPVTSSISIDNLHNGKVLEINSPNIVLTIDVSNVSDMFFAVDAKLHTPSYVLTGLTPDINDYSDIITDVHSVRIVGSIIKIRG